LNNITADMIQSLVVISCSHTERTPRHQYEIKLTDGRTRKGEIASLKLRSLIKSVAKEKITYFDSKEEDFKKSHVRGAKLGHVKTPLPDVVLSEIFSSN
jgi:hypothetical protein